MEENKLYKETIEVNNLQINILSKDNVNDFISLTDLARYKNSEFPKDVIKNWMRNRSTIEFLGLWEMMHNPTFKGVDFDTFVNEAGSNSFVMTPQKSIKQLEKEERAEKKKLKALNKLANTKKLK